MFCVDKINYEHLAILSNLKSCQFAPRIVISNLWICCQFEDSQIISPKIIPMSHRNINLWWMRAHFMQYIFLILLVHNSEFLENLINSYVPDHILMWSGTQWVLVKFKKCWPRQFSKLTNALQISIFMDLLPWKLWGKKGHRQRPTMQQRHRNPSSSNNLPRSENLWFTFCTVTTLVVCSENFPVSKDFCLGHVIHIFILCIFW